MLDTEDFNLTPFSHNSMSQVRIKELLSSHTLGELSDLKIPNQSDEQLLGTWFSLQSTMRVHSTFQVRGVAMGGTAGVRGEGQGGQQGLKGNLPVHVAVGD